MESLSFVENFDAGHRRLFNLLINSCSDEVLVLDVQQMKLVYANKKAIKNLGYTEGELFEINPSSVDIIFTADKVKSTLEQIQISNEQCITCNSVRTRKGSNSFNVIVSAFCYNLNNTEYLFTSGSESKIVSKTKDVRNSTVAPRVNIPAVLEKNNDLAGILNRISDGFLALDCNWNYTYINNNAGQLLGIDPVEDLGKNIWEEMPDFVGTPVHDSYMEAVREQKVVRIEGYFERFQKWFEASIYPSKDGVTVYFRDVSQEKESHLQLKESELKYRSVVENAQEGIWQIDENERTVFANRYLANLLGYQEEEMLGRTIFDFMTEDAKAHALELVDNRKSGIAEQHEFTLKRKDNSLVYVRLQTTPVTRQGKYAGALAMVLDITDRKKAEEKLVANERLYRALFQHSSDGIALISDDGLILEVSQSINKILGLTRDELIGTRRLDYIHPDYIEVIISTVQRVIEDSTVPLTVEYPAILPEGSKKWLECTYTNLLHDHNVNAIALNFRDITERRNYVNALKESEARYRNAERQGKLGHWELNFETNKIFWSDEIYQLFNLSKEHKEVDHKQFMSLVHPDDRTMVENELRLAWAGEKPYNIVHKVLLPGGIVKYMHEMAELVYDEYGKAVKFAGLVQDVTEQKMTENKLTASERNYKLIFEENPVPLWMIDANTLDFIEVNNESVLQYGYSKQEFQQLNVRDIRFKDEDSFLDLFKVRKEGRKRVDGVVKHRKKDGEVIFVKITSNQVVYNNREAWLGAGRNITRELLYEQNLKKSQQQLSLIFNSTVNGMILCKVEANNSYRIEEMNEPFCQLYSFQRENVIGRLITEIFTPEKSKVILSRYNTVVESGITQKFISFDKFYSVEKISEFTIVPLKDRQGVIEQLLIIRQDITEQRNAERKLLESEEKYRLLFEKNPQPMWIFDKYTLEILEVNQAAIEHYGYSREEFLAMNLYDIRPPQGVAHLQEYIDQQYPDTFNTFSYHRKKNGEVIKVEVSVNNIHFKNKEVRLALLTDRTEQEKAREQLVATTEQLRELASSLQKIREEERTIIAREIHDELGQQLTGLKMDISWINRKLDTADEKIISKMRSALDLIDTTINTVRKIATQLRPSIIDDLGLTAALDWQGRDFSNRTGISVSFFNNVRDTIFPPDVSISVFRIFQETLTNVLRHSKATKVNSTLELKDNKLILTVEDNGVGFNPEEQSGKRTLGLLGMKERAIMLNGTYNIVSSPGQGTVVSVEIPLL